jgi:segregation and condensation protein A
MRDHKIRAPSNIVYDETPIQIYIQRIHQQIIESGHRVAFSQMFRVGMHKSAMIGMFLAILELTRHHGVVAEQDDLDGEIWILPGENFNETLDLSKVDNYSGTAIDDRELKYRPR